MRLAAVFIVVVVVVCFSDDWRFSVADVGLRSVSDDVCAIACTCGLLVFLQNNDAEVLAVPLA
jgi:hypothetical protein